MIDALRRGLGMTAGSTDKDARLALERAYRKTFRTPEGRLVLTSMLEELCFFDPASTDEDKARKNYASLLIYRCGFRNTTEIVSAILDTTPTEEQK